MPDERHPPVINALNEYLSAQRLLDQVTTRARKCEAALEDAVLVALSDPGEGPTRQPPASGCDPVEVIVAESIVTLRPSDHRPAVSVRVVDRLAF